MNQDIPPLSPQKPPMQYGWKMPLEIVCGILMLLGIVIGFFSIGTGGILAGLSVGLGFYEEILSYILSLRAYVTEESIFKTLLLIGLGIYILLAATSFALSIAIGFAIMALLRWFASR